MPAGQKNGPVRQEDDLANRTGRGEGYFSRVYFTTESSSLTWSAMS
jgi:hypothetical protein